VRAGERIRITLRSSDAGMSHDFALREWGIASQLVKDSYSEEAIEFRAPLQQGKEYYVCTFHSAIMRGVLRVD